MEWEEFVNGCAKPAPSKRIMRAAERGYRLELDRIIACKGGNKLSKYEVGNFDLKAVQDMAFANRRKGQKNSLPVSFNLRIVRA